jgi:hypothetical protein
MGKFLRSILGTPPELEGCTRPQCREFIQQSRQRHEIGMLTWDMIGLLGPCALVIYLMLHFDDLLDRAVDATPMERVIASLVVFARRDAVLRAARVGSAPIRPCGPEGRSSSADSAASRPSSVLES